MKKSFLLLLLVLLTKISFGQDTLKIIYFQETETLVKQRFIDRYEDVFMTYVQPRHIKYFFGLGFLDFNVLHNFKRVYFGT
ncbi:hypothetical protein [Dyadobacter sp. 3J3]|uniref:hypothetical protein n=1 Tax=Dyadobacter sp. 3J3 TaxID=2606600 RepID=UPI00135852DB|nr:hypothetical protein [Dyadobacter sp. 3J3]